MRSFGSYACALAALLAGTGCTLFYPAPTPMRQLEYPASKDTESKEQASCVFILLPGMGDNAEDFERNGFVEEISQRKLSVDIRAAHATYGYYMRSSFTQRLAQDVVLPAKKKGYKEIWLMGPSMGGFGSLYYARHHPQEVTGVLAIAPYLGDDDVIEEIRKAGGLKTWKAPARVDKPNRDQYERELWRWLQAMTQGQESGPQLFIGYGREDKLASTDQLLAKELPPSQVFLTSGEHDWAPWRKILRAFLSSEAFAGHCKSGETSGAGESSE